MLIQDARKVIPYRSIGSMGTSQKIQTIFQKLMLKIVELFKSIGEIFKEFSPWKKTTNVEHAKIVRKKNFDAMKKKNPTIKISMPQRVDNTALKTINPATVSGVNNDKKEIADGKINQWSDILKGHVIGLAAIAGAGVLAGGLAYLIYNYNLPIVPSADFIPQSDPSLNTNIFQCPLPDFVANWSKIYEPLKKINVYQNLKTFNITSQCPLRDLSATLPYIIKPYKALSPMSSIPLKVSQSYSSGFIGKLPSFFEPVNKIINVATDSISVHGVSLGQSMKKLTPSSVQISKNLSKHALGIYNKVNSSYAHTSNHSSFSSLLNVLSKFLPSSDSLSPFSILEKVVVVSYLYDRSRQFWNKRQIDKNIIPNRSKVVPENEILTKKLKIKGNKESIPNRSNVVPENEIFNMELINKEISEDAIPEIIGEDQYDIKGFIELFNKFIKEGQKWVKISNDKMSSLDDDLTQSREYIDQIRYELNESINLTNHVVSQLEDLSNAKFEAQAIHNEHQTALFKDLIDLLSTITLEPHYSKNDFIIFRKLIDMLCSRVSNCDPISFHSAKQLLNNFLDAERLICPPNIIRKLASTIEIYKYKAEVENFNFGLENLNGQTELEQLYQNFELTRKYIEDNFTEIMLLGNSDEGLAEKFYALCCTALMFHNDFIHNNEDEWIPKVKESFLDTLDYIIFNNGKSEVETFDQESDISEEENIDEDDDWGTPNGKAILNTAEKKTPWNTPKAKWELTPNRELKNTPVYKLQIDEAKKKLCNELKGKLQPINNKQNIEDDFVTTKILDDKRILNKANPLSPHAKLTIEINSSLNKIIHLSKDLINQGNNESKAREKIALIGEVEKYFDANSETTLLKDEFVDLLMEIEFSLTELLEINENIKILGLNSPEVLNQNIDAQDHFGEYKKHDADKLKNLKLMKKEETEKFNNLKITFLTLGRNTANMIPLAEGDLNFINLKTPPPEHTSNRKNAFKTPIVCSVNE
nr:hypothetical protein [Parachlamydiaceae bacterium]